MESSRLTAKYQATIPKTIREHLAIGAGDRIAFRIVRGRVILEREPPQDAASLRAMEAALRAEWDSKEDDEAYGDL